MIARRDSKADTLVRWYWFSLSKILLLSNKLSKDNLDSITRPVEAGERVVKIMAEFDQKLKLLCHRYMPWIQDMTVIQGMSWKPSWKSMPNPRLHEVWKVGSDGTKASKPAFREVITGPLTSLFSELGAFALCLSEDSRTERTGLATSVPGLWCERLRWPFQPISLDAWEQDIMFFYKNVYPFFSELRDSSRVPLYQGKLAGVVEGGGKLRLFVIGNYVKQRLLKPYHDWAMSVLRRPPGDGTYHQTQPLGRLKGLMEVYSYDLKSATDRWPRLIIYQMLYWLFDGITGIAIVDSGLGYSQFLVNPPWVRSQKEINFQVGQPLGYYSSWALFALSHHAIVWLAADRVYPNRGLFKAYAILGDDVVIGDRRVAEEYYSIVSDLGVKISTAKSLISRSGAYEFASRFHIKGGLVDLSPISMRSLLLARSTMGLLTIFRTHSMKSFNVLFRIGGAGYRVLGSLRSRRSNRWERLWTVLHKPNSGCPLAFEFWLGGGIPLDPYLEGRLKARLIEAIKPKDIKLPKGKWYLDGLLSDDEYEILERTTLRSWMESWLAWVLWYNTVALNPYTRGALGLPCCREVVEAPERGT